MPRLESRGTQDDLPARYVTRVSSNVGPTPSLSSLEEVVERAKQHLDGPNNTSKPSPINTTRSTLSQANPASSSPVRRKSILKQSSSRSLRERSSGKGTESAHSPDSPLTQRYQLVTSPLIEVTITRSDPLGISRRLVDTEHRSDLTAKPLEMGSRDPIQQTIPRVFLKKDSTGESAASIASASGERADEVVPGGLDDHIDESYVARVSVFRFRSTKLSKT